MFDFLNSIYHELRDRFRNTFLNSFFISFIIYNWKAFLILFFSNSIIEKRINELSIFHFYGNEYYSYPLLFAFLYVILSEPINAFFDFVRKIGTYYRYYVKNKLNKTKEIYDKLRATHEGELALLKSKDVKIEEQKMEISRLINEREALEREVSNMDRIATERGTRIKELNELIEKDNNETKNIKLSNKTISEQLLKSEERLFKLEESISEYVDAMISADQDEKARKALNLLSISIKETEKTLLKTTYLTKKEISNDNNINIPFLIHKNDYSNFTISLMLSAKIAQQTLKGRNTLRITKEGIKFIETLF